MNRNKNTGDSRLKARIKEELTGNILPFWLKHARDIENNGFYGEISNNLEINKTAPKGLTFCARILWSFSAAYRMFPRKEYLSMADYACQYLMDQFYDKKYGGAFWLLDFNGRPLRPRKQIYGIVFCIYALAEYYQASGQKKALLTACELYKDVEKYCYDSVYPGYVEALSRDWQNMDDVRLSSADMNEKKSMNTHLHILEAYTNLKRIWNNAGLTVQLEGLLSIFIDHIIDADTHHLKLFFTGSWESRSNHISFGHDIEASWLLYEAAVIAGERKLLNRITEISIQMADAVYREGLNKDGSIIYEAEYGKVINNHRQWWAQAEGAVGFFNAYQLTGDKKFYNAFSGCWNYIEKYLIDREYGEWLCYPVKDRVSAPKAGMWKSAYHNSRACMEIIRRLK